MKVCKHYKEKMDGSYSNLIIKKQNQNYVCIQCYTKFDENDFQAVERFVNLMNQKMIDKEFVDENMIALQEQELPKHEMYD